MGDDSKFLAMVPSVNRSAQGRLGLGNFLWIDT